METKHLTYIITIAELKNMTKAAKKLYVSQSTLSQYLTKLETELETPLFDRARGELLLTPAGKLYVAAAKEMVEKQEKLYREIKALNHKGHISIGATSNFALEMLADLIPSYKKYYPDVTLEISELSLPAMKKMISEEGIDLGIAAAANEQDMPEQTKLLRNEPLYLAVCKDSPFLKDHPDKLSSVFAPMPLTKAEIIELFLTESLIHTKAGASIRLVADPWFESLRIKPDVICETNHMSSTLKMVENGAGTAFVGKSCVKENRKICYFDPKLTRLNVLFTRKGWPATNPEKLLEEMILSYF